MDNQKSEKQWLQKLKDESWEAELLVSAVATFSTFQLFSLVNWLTNRFIDLLIPNHYFVAYLIVYSGLLAVSILTSMFVIHFVLRSYWVGLVGLNSVFPDYGLDDSAYSKIYTEKLLNELPALKDSIENVDELCSVIFSAAFALLMIYTFLALIAGVLLVIYSLLSDYIPFTVLLFLVALFILLILLQASLSVIANLKKFREHEKVQTLYFKVVKYSSILMMGPFYKANMQITMTFGSNYKKNKNIARLLIMFTFIGVALSAYKISDTNVFYLLDNSRLNDESRSYSFYYANSSSSKQFLLGPQIQSDIVNDNAIKLFIPILSHEKKLIDRDMCVETKLEDDISRLESRQTKGFDKINCYQSYHKILLNDQPVTNSFIRHKLPDTEQGGVLMYIPLDNYTQGSYTLRIIKQFSDDNYHAWKIPFYYSQN